MLAGDPGARRAPPDHPRADPRLRARRQTAEHVYLGEAAKLRLDLRRQRPAAPGTASRTGWTGSPRACRPAKLSPVMAIEFGEKVRRIPVYPAADGYALGGAGRDARVQRVALPADPRRDRGRHQGADRAQPLPGPDERRAAAPAVGHPRRPGAADRDRQRLLRHPARRRRRAARAGRRARLRVAVLLRLPAPRRRLRRAGDRGAARRRPPPPARQDARGDHRRHAARDRLQPEQPDLDGAAAGRDRRLHRVGPAPRRA